MDAQWLDSAGDRLGGAWRSAAARLRVLAEPRRLRQIRVGLYALAALWMSLALAQLIWNLLPRADSVRMPADIVNPLQGGGRESAASAVDIEELANWNLFGAPAAESGPEPAAAAAVGVENAARQTRLNLKLQGIVASTEAGAARAIIEIQRQQRQYAPGDELSVSGTVAVAKILADRVVLDNGGRYELLPLYDESAAAAVGSRASGSVEPERPARRRLDKSGDRELTEMAEAYRRRLYANPRSLSDVVKISAVREDGRLLGYRVRAGRDRAQFERLGFRADDIVTGVNGIALTDPGKAMELYRVMRGADEASFNVLRGDGELTLVVGLEGGADDR